jgi:hypothetical protein
MFSEFGAILQLRHYEHSVWDLKIKTALPNDELKYEHF